MAEIALKELRHFLYFGKDMMKVGVGTQMP